MSFEPRENLLPADRIVRIASVARNIGIDHFKITGGEPTVRRDLPAIVEGIAALAPADLSMTTNGIHLPRLSRGLRDSGLDRVTISVDSLRADRYREITGGGRLELLQEGLDRRSDSCTVKLNVVVIRGVNGTRWSTSPDSPCDAIGPSVSSSSCRSGPVPRSRPRVAGDGRGDRRPDRLRGA